MINILSLLTITIGLAMQNVSKKLWYRKGLGGTMVFSAGSVFFALLTFLVSAFWGFELNIYTIFYSVLFATFYSMAVIFGMLAISKGPLSITSLIYSFSLIIPTFYGLFVLKEESSLSLYIGLVCLAISLCLINIEEKGEKKKLTWGWAVCMLLAFLGNGGCSTVQKMQIVGQKGAYKNEFMIVALTISFLTISVFMIIKERKTMASNVKKGLLLYAICGLANGLVNFLVIFLSSGRLPTSILFPFVSAGSIIVTFVISVLFFKEKLSKTQWIGFGFGTISIIFLNL